MAIKTLIIGTGSFIPANIISNAHFSGHAFYNETNEPTKLSAATIAEKFKLITGIKERRYVDDNMTTSQMGFFAAQKAIADAGINKETIDQIIFAHNFGDILHGTNQSQMVPSLASRVKHLLEIRNPNCISYDLIFGCPGWIQGVLQADAFIKADIAKRILVIGAETLSRVIDKSDWDSMIFSDGAGACVLDAKQVSNIITTGILGISTQSFTGEEIEYLYYGQSNFLDADANIHFLKMKGRKLYDFALAKVPRVIKDCLEKSNVELKAIKMFFLHQANEKMDIAIVKALYKLYGEENVPENKMPMSIQELGNSSVATIPTLFDLVRHGEIENHSLQLGDVIMFASVGAGMNVNAFCYRV